MTDTENIYVTPRLKKRFCDIECFNKEDCHPTVLKEVSPIHPEQSLRIMGLIAQAECPIANRVLSEEGWSPGPWGCER